MERFRQALSSSLMTAASRPPVPWRPFNRPESASGAKSTCSRWTTTPWTQPVTPIVPSNTLPITRSMRFHTSCLRRPTRPTPFEQVRQLARACWSWALTVSRCCASLRRLRHPHDVERVSDTGLLLPLRLPCFGPPFAPASADIVKTKADIVRDWLPRYTGRPLEEFGQFVLLSNFIKYVELFAERFGVEVAGRDHPMQSATAENLTILNFGMGSAMAATVMDLLAAVEPKAVLFLGKCGGLKKTKVGDFILPIAAIRGEGASNDYMPSEIPALPSFRLQRRRLHHDRQTRPRLLDRNRLHNQSQSLGARPRFQGVPQEDPAPRPSTWRPPRSSSSASSTTSPRGAFSWSPDSPMTPEGVKSSRSDKAVTERFVRKHLEIGIDSLIELRDSGASVKHMRFESIDDDRAAHW